MIGSKPWQKYLASYDSHNALYPKLLRGILLQKRYYLYMTQLINMVFFNNNHVATKSAIKSNIVWLSQCLWSKPELYKTKAISNQTRRQSTKPARVFDFCFWYTIHWRHTGRDGVSNHQPHDCLLNRLFRRRSKKTSDLRVVGLCAVNSPVTDEFPAQMASNAENVSILWRHHACIVFLWPVYTSAGLFHQE